MKKALFNTTVFDAGLPKFVAGQHYELTDEVRREIARGNATEVELPDPKPEKKAKAAAVPPKAASAAVRTGARRLSRDAQARHRAGEEPLTLAEAKPTRAHDADDPKTTRLIAAARKHTESFLQRALCTQTWDWFLDYGFGRCVLELPMPPIRA